jgi:hypothetical protein
MTLLHTHTTRLHVLGSRHVNVGNSKRNTAIRRQSALDSSSAWDGVKPGVSPQGKIQQDFLPGTELDSTQSVNFNEAELPINAVTTSFALSSNGSQPEAFPRPSEAYTPISSPGPSNSEATGTHCSH